MVHAGNITACNRGQRCPGWGDHSRRHRARPRPVAGPTRNSTRGPPAESAPHLPLSSMPYRSPAQVGTRRGIISRTGRRPSGSPGGCSVIEREDREGRNPAQNPSVCHPHPPRPLRLPEAPHRHSCPRPPGHEPRLPPGRLLPVLPRTAVRPRAPGHFRAPSRRTESRLPDVATEPGAPRSRVH